MDDKRALTFASLVRIRPLWRDAIRRAECSVGDGSLGTHHLCHGRGQVLESNGPLGTPPFVLCPSHTSICGLRCFFLYINAFPPLLYCKEHVLVSFFSSNITVTSRMKRVSTTTIIISITNDMSIFSLIKSCLIFC